jgi:anti-anti-sigma factor
MHKNYPTVIETRHGHLWIVLPDSIDMDNYLDIEEEILPTLEKSPQDVVLDFSRTKALFSSGIGLIVRLQKRVRKAGKKLSLVSIEPKIREGLKNVGLGSAFDIYTSEEEFMRAQEKG